jgi:hypothetical protein
MTFIHNEVRVARFGLDLSLVAGFLALVVVLAAAVVYAGPTPDAMWIVGP